ncbi:polysaccharide deacetylase family protein (plasmid) [Haloferacaceae archaeon DSL9]
MLGDHSFALCLTHDVDRPYKTYHSVYYALTRKDPRHVGSLLPGVNTFWTYQKLMDLEDDLGVRSAFYFLQEQRLFGDRHPREWFTSEGWRLYAGRYDLDDPRIVDLIHELDAGGWEVGIHGSYESYLDRDRLAEEKQHIERILGREILGGRQHYLNLSIPTTWKHHADIGLKYDASLGSSSTYGFTHGYSVQRPFDDDFVEFPLTIMEIALPDVETDIEHAWRECERILEEAAANDAVMTILWHPRFFSELDFPNYTELYRRIIERALEMGAWVGPPGELYERLDHPDDDRGDGASNGHRDDVRAARFDP